MTEILTMRLLDLALSVLRLSAWLAILAAIFVPLERVFAASPREVFRKGVGVDLCYFFLSGLAPSLLLGLPAGLIAWTVRHLVPGTVVETMAALPAWGRVVIGLVAGEIGYYWGHRWSHEVPALWRFHAIHHSAEHVDFLVNTRAHPIDLVFGRLCSLIPIYALGLGGPSGPAATAVPVLVTLIATAWGFFIHANLRWRFGPLEWLISTPAFHHWHHTRTGPLNKNYAATLPWLDRLFGTHHLPGSAWPESYGIKAEMPSSFVDQLAHPLLPPLPRPKPDTESTA